MKNCYFEKVSRFADVDFDMPKRKTAESAGYDMVVAEDVTILPYNHLMTKLDFEILQDEYNEAYTLDQLAALTKKTKAKPTLVSTGVKCHMPHGTFLELSVRSSCPLKYWLVMANGVGIIDADYADNPDNEGEIYFQIINFSTVPIKLRRGDVIGQGILRKFETTDDDVAEGERVGGFGSTDG